MDKLYEMFAVTSSGEGAPPFSLDQDWRAPIWAAPKVGSIMMVSTATAQSQTIDLTGEELGDDADHGHQHSSMTQTAASESSGLMDGVIANEVRTQSLLVRLSTVRASVLSMTQTVCPF